MEKLEFNKGVKAADVARNICPMYGVNAIGESMARKWFSHFDISDTPRSGRHSGTQELANVINCEHSIIVIVVDLAFTMLLTSQVISIAFYSEREKSDKFCSEAPISA